MMIVRSILAAAFLVAGILSGAIFSAETSRSRSHPELPKTDVATVHAGTSADGLVRHGEEEQHQTEPIFTTYAEGEWMKVPVALIHEAEGWSVLPFLFVSPEEEYQGTTKNLAKKLHLSPTDDQRLQRLLSRAIMQWAKMERPVMHAVNATTWRLDAPATDLSQLRAQIDREIQETVGSERAHVFRCLALRDMDLLFSNPQLWIELMDEGRNVKFGSGGGTGMVIDRSQIAPSSPLEFLLISLKP